MTPGAMRIVGAPWVGITAAIGVVALDQASKWWILEHVMRPPRVIELTGFFKDVEHSADRVVDDLDVAKVLRSKLAPTRFLA